MQLSAGAVLLSMQAFVSFMRIRGKDFVNYVQDSRTQSCRCFSVGQNILGYRPYADDVVEYFVQKSLANGIDIIRIFRLYE